MVAFGRALIVPDFASKTSINSPNVVGSGEIQNAVYFKRRGLDDCGVWTKSPCEGKRADVSGIDLIELTESHARVVTVVGRPRVCRRFEQSCWIESLPCGR